MARGGGHSTRGGRARVWTVVAGGLALGVASLAPAAIPGAGPGPAAAAGLPSTPMQTCLWRGPVQGTKAKYSTYAFPDYSAVYWTAVVSMPAGSQLQITGSFPHARYSSFSTYDQNGSATDHLVDAGIVPDAGSSNPFLPGADRTVTARSYTLGVLDQPAPATPSANTLYAGVSGQSTQVLVYRIYLNDQGMDATGGVGLPQVSLTLADNTVLTGTQMCKALAASKNPPPNLALSLSSYLTLRDKAGEPATFPAQDPPVFMRPFNTPDFINCVYYATCNPSPVASGGFYANADNAYVVAMVNRGFGDGSVLVLRGHLPSTPKTFGGEATMAGGPQLRYWSICQNESLTTTRTVGCLNDEQVPTDAGGDYIIVTSTTKDRPKNATAACGVAYLPWPKHGDGAGHLNDGMLILRNMLPDPTDAQAVQNVTTFADAPSVMGSDLPTGQYTTKTAFQALGCPA